MLSTSALAIVTPQQYDDAANELISIFEIINSRGMKCDAGLDAIGIEAVLSEHCNAFMNSGDLIAKVAPQCTVLLQWTDENPLDGKDIKITIKSKFIAEYCVGQPPSRYPFINKVFKKINLLSGK